MPEEEIETPVEEVAEEVTEEAVEEVEGNVTNETKYPADAEAETP